MEDYAVIKRNQKALRVLITYTKLESEVKNTKGRALGLGYAAIDVKLKSIEGKNAYTYFLICGVKTISERCPQTNTGFLQEGNWEKGFLLHPLFCKLLNIQPGECIICAENKYH